MKKLLAGLGLSTLLLINNLEAIPVVEIEKINEKKSVKKDIFDYALDEMEKGNLEEAINKLEFLVALDEDDADNHGCLGLIYELAGNKEKAASEIKMSLMLNPLHELFYRKIALDYKNKKDYEKSIFYTTQMIENNPKNPILHKFLGSVYYEINRYDEAINEMYKAVEHDKLNSKFYFDIGDMSMSWYFKTKNKNALKNAVYSFIIYNELKPDMGADELAKMSYELLNDIYLEDNPNSIDNLIWQKHKLEVEIDFLKDIYK